MFVYSRNNLNDLFCIKYETRLYSEVSSGVVGYMILEYIFEPLLMFFLLLLFLFSNKCISHLTFILDMLRVCIF